MATNLNAITSGAHDEFVRAKKLTKRKLAMQSSSKTKHHRDELEKVKNLKIKELETRIANMQKCLKAQGIYMKEKKTELKKANKTVREQREIITLNQASKASVQRRNFQLSKFVRNVMAFSDFPRDKNIPIYKQLQALEDYLQKKLSLHKTLCGLVGTKITECLSSNDNRSMPIPSTSAEVTSMSRIHMKSLSLEQLASQSPVFCHVYPPIRLPPNSAHEHSGSKELPSPGSSDHSFDSTTTQTPNESLATPASFKQILKKTNGIQGVIKILTPMKQTHGENVSKRVDGRGQWSIGGKHYCLCGQSFSVKPDLLSHVRLMTKEMNFKCESCPLKFRRLTQLKCHRRLNHSTPAEAHSQIPVKQIVEQSAAAKKQGICSTMMDTWRRSIGRPHDDILTFTNT